jgi:hypothetical protein
MNAWNVLKELNDLQFNGDPYFCPYLRMSYDYLLHLETSPKGVGRSGCKRILVWILQTAMFGYLCYGGTFEFLTLIHKFHPMLFRNVLEGMKRDADLAIKDVSTGNVIRDRRNHRCVVMLYFTLARTIFRRFYRPDMIEFNRITALSLGFNLRHPYFLYFISYTQISHLKLKKCNLPTSTYQKIMNEAFMYGSTTKEIVRPPEKFMTSFPYPRYACSCTEDKSYDVFSCVVCDFESLLECSWRCYETTQASLFQILYKKLEL